MNASSAPTALIAEDEPLLAEGLRAELARLWPELKIVAVAGDGLQAAEQALLLKPSVCFLDIRMPGQSGLDAARALAEDWPDGAPGLEGPHFPLLVFVTAYDQYALQAFDAQAVDYLLKPVQGDRLAACVLRLQRLLAARQGAAQELQASVERLRALVGLVGWAVGWAGHSLQAMGPRRYRAWKSSRRRSAPPCIWCRSTRCCISKPPTSTCASSRRSANT